MSMLLLLITLVLSLSLVQSIPIESREEHGSKYNPGVRCYDCNYSPSGYIQSPSGTWKDGYKELGFQQCGLRSTKDSDQVDKWVCSSGACFIRQDSNGLVYRGCADQENLPFDVQTEQNCKYQGPKKSLWWFCEGDLCNSGQLGDTEKLCGSPPPPPGYEHGPKGYGLNKDIIDPLPELVDALVEQNYFQEAPVEYEVAENDGRQAPLPYHDPIHSAPHAPLYPAPHAPFYPPPHAPFYPGPHAPLYPAPHAPIDSDVEHPEIPAIHPTLSPMYGSQGPIPFPFLQFAFPYNAPLHNNLTYAPYVPPYAPQYLPAHGHPLPAHGHPLPAPGHPLPLDADHEAAEGRQAPLSEEHISPALSPLYNHAPYYPAPHYPAPAPFPFPFAPHAQYAPAPGHEYVAPEYAAPEYAAPEYVAPEYVAPEYVAPEYVAPEYVAPEYVAPEYVAPEYPAQHPHALPYGIPQYSPYYPPFYPPPHMPYPGIPLDSTHEAPAAPVAPAPPALEYPAHLETSAIVDSYPVEVAPEVEVEEYDYEHYIEQPGLDGYYTPDQLYVFDEDHAVPDLDFADFNEGYDTVHGDYARQGGLYDPCNGDCVSNPSGLFADLARQDHFIQCGFGDKHGAPCNCCKALYMKCPVDTVFDDVSKVCVRPDGLSGGLDYNDYYGDSTDYFSQDYFDGKDTTDYFEKDTTDYFEKESADYTPVEPPAEIKDFLEKLPAEHFYES